ncbi:hypothetical protein FJ364_06005, partial [Candidatus Dependentiae bacterium]|nr:hypothetical protein [Candidatus Dependentiae bacterium]
MNRIVLGLVAFCINLQVSWLSAADTKKISPESCLDTISQVCKKLRNKTPVTRHNSHNKKLLQTFSQALHALLLLESNEARKVLIQATINSVDVDLETHVFDNERMAMLAEQLLIVIATDDQSVNNKAAHPGEVLRAEEEMNDLDLALNYSIVRFSENDEIELEKLRREFAA